jgi:hypothetical protein
MNRFIFGILLLGIVGAMTVGISNLPTARADDVCEFTDTNQECNLKIKKLNVEDDFNLKIINSVGGSDGGNGDNVSTVDQEARDRVTALENENVNIKNQLDAANGNLTSISNALDAAVSENGAQNAKIAELEATLANLSAVTDISLENGTGTGNQTQPPPSCLPSQFFNATSGACQDIVVPQPDGNQTNGNTTNGDGNQTNGDGNQTNGGNGNVTEPTDNQTNGGNGNGDFEPEPEVEPTSFDFNIGKVFGFS